MKLSQKRTVIKKDRGNSTRNQSPATKPGETLSQFVGRKLLGRR